MLAANHYTLAIADSATDSAKLSTKVSAGEVIHGLADVVIYSPVAGTIKLSPTPGGDLFVYQRDGVDFAVTAGATQLPVGAFGDLQFIADDAVGDPTDIIVALQWDR